MIKQQINNKININEVLVEIRHIKEQAEKFSRLLGAELTCKIIEVIEGRENDVLENLMWWSA